MNNNCKKFIIEKEKVLEINNKFRSLGLNQKLLGTKLLNKTQIRMAIKYTLINRNENACKKILKKFLDLNMMKIFFIQKTLLMNLFMLLIIFQ